MNKKLIVKKGYTLEVASSENDGDNTSTKSQTYDNLDDALRVFDICKTVFACCNNNGGGIGNMCEDRDDPMPVINEYLEKNPEAFQMLCMECGIENGNIGEDGYELVMELNFEMMGCSEWYYSKYFDKGTITYSPEDIYLEEIKTIGR